MIRISIISAIILISVTIAAFAQSGKNQTNVNVTIGACSSVDSLKSLQLPVICGCAECKNKVEEDNNPILLKYFREPYGAILNILFACLAIFLAIIALLDYTDIVYLLGFELVSGFEILSIKSAVAIYCSAITFAFVLTIALAIIPNSNTSFCIALQILLALLIAFSIGMFLALMIRIVGLLIES
jgi:hypothetical protein